MKAKWEKNDKHVTFLILKKKNKKKNENLKKKKQIKYE